MYGKTESDLGIAIPAALMSIGGLFSGSTEGKNPERIAINTDLEARALNGDEAAFSQLKQRAIPGVLPYIVATNDAKVRVVNVLAQRSASPTSLPVPFYPTTTTPAPSGAYPATTAGLFSNPLVLGAAVVGLFLLSQGKKRSRKRR